MRTFAGELLAAHAAPRPWSSRRLWAGFERTFGQARAALFCTKGSGKEYGFWKGVMEHCVPFNRRRVPTRDCDLVGRMPIHDRSSTNSWFVGEALSTIGGGSLFYRAGLKGKRLDQGFPPARMPVVQQH